MGGYKTKTKDLGPKNEVPPPPPRPSKLPWNHHKMAETCFLPKAETRNTKDLQQDLRLSTNFIRVFVLFTTLPKVQNKDPFKIGLKSLQKINGSKISHGEIVVHVLN